MSGIGASGVGAVRTVPLAAKVVSRAFRLVLYVPPLGWGAAVALGLMLLVALRGTYSPYGLAPGLALTGFGVAAIVYWVRVVRPSEKSVLILLCEFSERSTDAGVTFASVHGYELAARLAGEPLVAGEVEARRLPPLSKKTVLTVLRRSRANVIVRGDVTTAGGTVKLSASVAYRLMQSPVYAARDSSGQPAARLGPQSWSAARALQLPVDAAQPISILTEADFPAGHANGIVLLGLILRAAYVESEAELAQIARRIDSEWKTAPTPVQGLLRNVQAQLALDRGGWNAGRAVWERAISTEGIDDHALRVLYAGALAVACSHGLDSSSRWLTATDGLVARSTTKPEKATAAYMRGCALMAAGLWGDALELWADTDLSQFGGPLGPPRAEVASAVAQAADLADDLAMRSIAVDQFRRALRRRWYQRKISVESAEVWVWLVAHSYDTLALPAIDARMSELGRSVGDLLTAREQAKT